MSPWFHNALCSPVVILNFAANGKGFVKLIYKIINSFLPARARAYLNTA